ncbi:MAG TPA: S24 family peptidase [Methylococcaceae bacterium]|jgi:SOS-response transcriptional repressor LexA|nr:S24 family peptidase [Methylococcaceae bacterium]
MSLGQRLKQAREMAQLSQRGLAKRSLLSQQLISKLENGLVESTTEVFRLAEALGVDPRWLATGKGDVRSGDNVTEGPAILAYVPLISWVAAGSWREVVDPYPPGEGESLVPVTCRVGTYAYALRVQGDSMEPMFPNGSVIIVDPGAEPRQGSYVIVRLDDAEQATFKQLVIDGGARYLKPLNPRYPVMEIKERATLCGVVRQMVMDFD